MAANRTYPLKIRLDTNGNFEGYQELTDNDARHLRYLIRKDFATKTNQAGWLALNNNIGNNRGTFSDTRIAATGSASNPFPNPIGTATIDKSVLTTDYTIYENTTQPSTPTITDSFAAVFDHESKYPDGYFEPNGIESDIVAGVIKDVVREMFFSSSNGSAGDPNNSSGLLYDGIGSFVIQNGTPGTGTWTNLGEIRDRLFSAGSDDETANLWVKTDDTAPTVGDLPMIIDNSGSQPSMRPMTSSEVTSQFTTYLQRYLTSGSPVYRWTDAGQNSNEEVAGTGDTTIEDTISNVITQGSNPYFFETISGTNDQSGGAYRLLRDNVLGI